MSPTSLDEVAALDRYWRAANYLSGVELDSDLNEGATPDADIAAAGSAVRVLVIAAREVLVATSAVRAPLDPST